MKATVYYVVKTVHLPGGDEPEVERVLAGPYGAWVDANNKAAEASRCYADQREVTTVAHEIEVKL